MLTEKIIEGAKSCGVFSIMVDEAGCDKRATALFCICYVDDKLTSHEWFLLFKDCSTDHNASELACYS